jgi:hypothetical protein
VLLLRIVFVFNFSEGRYVNLVIRVWMDRSPCGYFLDTQSDLIVLAYYLFIICYNSSMGYV